MDSDNRVLKVFRKDINLILILFSLLLEYIMELFLHIFNIEKVGNIYLNFNYFTQDYTDIIWEPNIEHRLCGENTGECL